MQERLQKILARAGYGSRRSNEAIISSGRVRVNGQIAKLGNRADPTTDIIEVDGVRIQIEKEKYIYIALNKPRGVISSLEDELQQNRTTVRDLISLPGHLYPVGRLDKPSEGLILMTNDGQLAHRLTHPRYQHKKVYEVELEGSIPDSSLEQWREGIILDGRKTAPARITIIKRDMKTTMLQVTLREGRKRQIRRIAASFGHPVRRLVRIKMGPIKLGKLLPGQWRYLSEAEISRIRSQVSEDRTFQRRKTR
ncbi:MAG: pseudouridine synthase [Candidatus Promineifilaceae bacterium]|nr:pseudouridine synthase [Candidatus Promineifilaceae bacterium]